MSHHDAAHHHTADDEYRETLPGAGHEHTDAEIGPIVQFGIWIVAIAIVVHFGAYFMFYYMADQRAAANVSTFPLAPPQPEVVLPQGAWRLQRFPANEAYEFQLQEQHLARTYGWVDRGAGTVRIPIDEAMRLALSRGLASRGQAAAAPAAGDTPGPATAAAGDPIVHEVPGMMPTDASAGRVMERRRQ